jgi:hypothetical protein
VVIKTSIFRDIMHYGKRRDSSFTLVSCLAHSLTLKKVITYSYETVAAFQWRSRRYNPEKRTLRVIRWFKDVPEEFVKQ